MATSIAVAPATADDHTTLTKFCLFFGGSVADLRFLNCLIHYFNSNNFLLFALFSASNPYLKFPIFFPAQPRHSLHLHSPPADPNIAFGRDSHCPRPSNNIFPSMVTTLAPIDLWPPTHPLPSKLAPKASPPIYPCP